MELVKDIYFNTDKLIENTNVKVSYTGEFYQKNNEKVYLHYGYGKNWNNVNEIEMEKTDLGYQAELKLIEDDSLNLCFKNQNNEWDNNFGQNYIFNIEKNMVTPTSKSKENNFIFGNKSDSVYGYTALKSDMTTEEHNFNIISPSDESETITEVCESTKSLVVKQPETLISFAPTGFNYWTRKIKETVCKFFSYVPKLISGNYKRNLSDNNNNNK